MKSLGAQLSQYGQYHRDRRNRATHYVGIPVIVLAVLALLSRPAIELGAVTVTPAHIVVLGALLYYWRLDAGFALAMTVVLAAALWFGARAALLDRATWLALGVGGFVAGWALQFIGHAFEGRKPAFLDDLASLLIGPLFVLAEAMFALGLYRTLAAQVAGKGATPT